MIPCTLTKNPIIHQYCNNFQNQSQEEYQAFHQMKIYLTNQFLVTKKNLKKSVYNVS